jgi:hypothetical protein
MRSARLRQPEVVSCDCWAFFISVFFFGLNGIGYWCIFFLPEKKLAGSTRLDLHDFFSKTTNRFKRFFSPR